MMDKKYLIYIALILAGAVFSEKIRALPLMNKLPTA